MQQKFSRIKMISAVSLLGLLTGCACDFLGLEHVVESKTPFEKRAEEEKKQNPYEAGGESDMSTAGNLKSIYFDYKTVQLKPDQLEVLDSNIEELIRYPNITLTLVAHTDSVGGPTYNNKLSKARAHYVVQYMISKGLSADRLHIQIKGPLEPVSSDNSEQIKSYVQILKYKKQFTKNRRINFIVR